MRDKAKPGKGPAAQVCLVGHLYAPIGRGEDMRCVYRSLRSVAAQPTLVDIYQLQTPSDEDLAEFSEACVDRLGAINVFHVNGDEVEDSLQHLGSRYSPDAYNVVYPAWELAKYPHEWAAQLDRFDEIWAPSQFVYEALSGVCTRPVFHMALSCEVRLASFLSRRYFGLPESEFIFLFFFDVRSYLSRKNPDALIGAFRGLLSQRRFAKTRLVLKVNGAELAPDAMERLRGELEDISDHIVVIDRVMSDNEVKNLVRCCDCFVSLHRSEGYGRGLAEAMHLGKPVIATAYSGNMDYMTDGTSMAVDYELIPVKEGEYPYWEGQVWADADVEQASAYMIRLLDDPCLGRELGRRASIRIRTEFGYRPGGVRYDRRLAEIQGQSDA